MALLWRAAACQLLGVLILVRSSQPANLAEGDFAEGDRWGSQLDLLAHLKNSVVAIPGEESLALIRLCVSQSWWTAARELISRMHVQGTLAPSLEQEVSKLMGEFKRSADDLAAYADATYRGQTKGLDEVHCAIQWAQNSTAIFLGVKYTARWNSPGAIEVVDVSVNITPCCFVLEGFGHHSSIRKRYMVNLELYQDLLPESSSWSAASVGRLTATLQKAKGSVKWPRLVKGKEKHASKSHIGKWLDMEEKWENELKKAKTVKENKKSDKTNDKKGKSKDSKNMLPQFFSTIQKKLRRWSKKAMAWLGHNTGLKCCLLATFAALLFFAGSSIRRRRPTASDDGKIMSAADAAEARMHARTGTETNTPSQAEESLRQDNDPTED